MPLFISNILVLLTITTQILHDTFIGPFHCAPEKRMKKIRDNVPPFSQMLRKSSNFIIELPVFGWSLSSSDPRPAVEIGPPS